tara:strand:+ start:1834 stop:3429 length:1596 start_codon:yes stop_codon:yes gene_type:complete
MRLVKKSDNLIVVFLILFFLISLKVDFRFQDTVYCCGDDHDYYIHAETIAVDYDLDYSNQLKGLESQSFTRNNKIAPTGYIGTGILSSPFLFLGHTVDKIFSKSPNLSNSLFNFRLMFYSLSSVTYFFISFLLIYKTIKLLKLDISKFELLLILFGSGISYFAFERYSMTHIYEMFTVALLSYISLKFYIDNKKNNLYAFIIPIIVLIGLLTKWVNYFLFFIPLLIKGFINKKNYMEPSLLKNKYFYISSMISCTTFLLHTNILYGAYTFDPQYPYQTGGKIDEFYSYVGGFIEFISINIINSFKILFSQEFGIFWFSPIIFIGLLIQIITLTNTSYLKISSKVILFISFAQIFAIVLLWRSTASSYGYRYLYCLIPLSILIYAKYKKQFPKNKIRYYVIGFSIFSSLSVLFFETTLLTQLSTVEIINTYGRELKYAQPQYLYGYIMSFGELSSYLKIFTTSFFGAIFFKFSFLIFGKEKFIAFLENLNLPVMNDDFITYAENVNNISEYKFLFIAFYFLFIAYGIVKKLK